VPDRRTSKYRGGWLVLVSLLLAVAASLFALLGPTGSEEEAVAAVPAGTPLADRPEPEIRTTTMLGQIRSGEEDAFVLVWLVVPVVAAAAPLALARTPLDDAARTVAATLLLAFAFVTGFSIGLYYLPSAWTMVAAAAVGWSSR
jgi:hypothetical protein